MAVAIEASESRVLPREMWEKILSYPESQSSLIASVNHLFYKICHDQVLISRQIDLYTVCVIKDLSYLNHDLIQRIKREVGKRLLHSLPRDLVKFFHDLPSPSYYSYLKLLLREEDKNLIWFFGALQKSLANDSPVTSAYEKLKAAVFESEGRQATAIRAFMSQHQIFWASVKELDLSCSGLTRLPEELRFFSSVKTLSLRGNLLHFVPKDNVLDWTGLHKLDAKLNRQPLSISPKAAD